MKVNFQQEEKTQVNRKKRNNLPTQDANSEKVTSFEGSRRYYIDRNPSVCYAAREREREIVSRNYNVRHKLKGEDKVEQPQNGQEWN